MYLSDLYMTVISLTINIFDSILLAWADALRHTVIFHPTASVLSDSSCSFSTSQTLHFRCKKNLRTFCRTFLSFKVLMPKNSEKKMQFWCYKNEMLLLKMPALPKPINITASFTLNIEHFACLKRNLPTTTPPTSKKQTNQSNTHPKNHKKPPTNAHKPLYNGTDFFFCANRRWKLRFWQSHNPYPTTLKSASQQFKVNTHSLECTQCLHWGWEPLPSDPGMRTSPSPL